MCIKNKVIHHMLVLSKSKLLYQSHTKRVLLCVRIIPKYEEEGKKNLLEVMQLEVRVELIATTLHFLITKLLLLHYLSVTEIYF